MFKENLGRCLFARVEDDKRFPQIFGDASFAGDYSMLALARILLAKRISGDDQVQVLMRIANVNARTPDEALGVACDTPKTKRSMLTIADVRGTSMVTSDFFNRLDQWESAFLKLGYRKMHRVENRMFPSRYKTYVYQNERDQHTVIFPLYMTLRHYHLLQCFIPAYFRWYCTGKNGIDEKELMLINAARKKDPDSYLEMLKFFAKTRNVSHG